MTRLAIALPTVALLVVLGTAQHTSQSVPLDPVAAIAMTLRNPYPHPSNMVSVAGGETESNSPLTISFGQTYDVYEVPEDSWLVVTRWELVERNSSNNVVLLTLEYVDQGGVSTTMRTPGINTWASNDINVEPILHHDVFVAGERGGMVVPPGATIRLHQYKDVNNLDAKVKLYNLDGYLVPD